MIIYVITIFFTSCDDAINLKYLLLINVSQNIAVYSKNLTFNAIAGCVQHR